MNARHPTSPCQQGVRGRKLAFQAELNGIKLHDSGLLVNIMMIGSRQ